MPRLRDQRGRFARAEIPTKPALPALGKTASDADSFLVPKDKGFVGSVAVPHHLTFAAIWQSISQTYRSLSDEAKKANYQNALAMRRDAFVMKLLRARQYPVVELPFTIEVEDGDDEYQKQVAAELTAMVNAIPRFQYLKLNLQEAIWYGKAGVQLEWNWVTIGGMRRLIPTAHLPVNGDKIQYKWDGTPGVLVYRPYHPDGADIEQTDWGPVLFLYDEYYRDRFIIHEFEPDDTDYLFEADLAGGVHGVGLRSRIYWVYQIRHEVLGWSIDALQRVGTNGMLVGRFPMGNEQAQEAVTQALTDLIAKNVCTFPVDPGHEQTTDIEAIEPATTAYDVLMSVTQYFDDNLREAILGQQLSSGTGSTGMGSEVADLHALTLERIIRYDAQALSETLTKDLVAKLIKYNYGDIPFSVKLKLQVERNNVKDTLIAAKALWDMGVKLDEESLRDQAGFIAPRSPENAIFNPNAGSTDNRFGDVDKVGDNSVHTEMEVK